MNAEELILQAVSYFNLFDYPLKKNEIINLIPGDHYQNNIALTALIKKRKLNEYRDYIFIPGRNYIIEKRKNSEKYLKKNLIKIKIAASIISHFPFVRGVFLTGSAAKGALYQYDDYDFFIIVKNGYLWTCKSIINIFRTIISLNHKNNLHKLFCCNSFLSEKNMSINDRNKFTALEITFARPMYNIKEYSRFFRENQWTEEHFLKIQSDHDRFPVRFRIPIIRTSGEMILKIISLFIPGGGLELLIKKKYQKLWLKKKYVANIDEINIRSSSTWIKAECGHKRNFLLDHFNDYDSKEFNSLLRTRVNLKARSASGSGTDILLTHSFYVNLTRTERKVMRPYFPLGPLYIAGYLRKKNFKVDVYDCTFDKNISAFSRYLLKKSPPVVGIYATELCRRNALTMIKCARETGSCVIMGGPDPSADPQYYIDNGADFVVVGEGEETIEELLRAIKTGESDIYTIPGLYSDRGISSPRNPFPDMDTLPLPARDLVDFTTHFNKMKSKYGITSLMINTSRGCPFDCAWCSRAVSGKFFRQRSVESVVNEMKEIKKIYDVDHIWFTDDCFILSENWLESFASEVIQRDAIIPYECFARADSIDGNKLKMLHDSGCTCIWYGAESGSQDVLNRMKKGILTEDILHAVELTKKQKIYVGLNIMLAYPGEKIKDIEATREMLQKTKPDQLIVKYSYPLTGTDFYNEVKPFFSGWRKKNPRDINLRLSYKSGFNGGFYFIVKMLLLKEHKISSGQHTTIKDYLLYIIYINIYRVLRLYYNRLYR